MSLTFRTAFTSLFTHLFYYTGGTLDRYFNAKPGHEIKLKDWLVHPLYVLLLLLLLLAESSSKTVLKLHVAITKHNHHEVECLTKTLLEHPVRHWGLYLVKQPHHTANQPLIP